MLITLVFYLSLVLLSFGSVHNKPEYSQFKNFQGQTSPIIDLKEQMTTKEPQKSCKEIQHIQKRPWKQPTWMLQKTKLLVGISGFVIPGPVFSTLRSPDIHRKDSARFRASAVAIYDQIVVGWWISMELPRNQKHCNGRKVTKKIWPNGHPW